jgi:hypothetical protein
VESREIPCYLIYKYNTYLSMPQPRNSLGDADVVCLEGVQCQTERDGSDAESPVGCRADLGNALGGEVVDDA